MTRTAKVLYLNKLAGYLVEDSEGYKFSYEKNYILEADSKPVGITLPLTKKVYRSNTMFPFFDGLIPARAGFWI